MLSVRPTLAYINTTCIINKTTSMNKNIHSHTHVMDEKWIFLLIINIDTSEKLCRNLFEIERSSPPPLQSSISMESSQKMESLGRATMCAQKGKGMQTQACMNGATIH